MSEIKPVDIKRRPFEEVLARFRVEMFALAVLPNDDERRAFWSVIDELLTTRAALEPGFMTPIPDPDSTAAPPGAREPTTADPLDLGPSVIVHKGSSLGPTELQGTPYPITSIEESSSDESSERRSDESGHTREDRREDESSLG